MNDFLVLLFILPLSPSFALFPGVLEIETSTKSPPVTEPLLIQTKPNGCGCEDDKLMNGINYWLDIIFVVDSTNAVAFEDFTGLKSFISSFGNFQIGPTFSNPKRYTRVAIINTAAQADVIANLTTFKSGAELREVVTKNLIQKGGTVFNVEAGLQAAREILIAERKALHRTNVRKAVILFSSATIDCHSTRNSKVNKEVLCSIARYLRDQANLITVGLKTGGTSKYPLIDIATSCNTLDNTVDMMLNVLKALCRANCFCKKPYTQFTKPSRCESYGECLFVHQLSLPFKTAVETCHNDGTTLATVTSAEKEEFLKNLHLNASFYPYWIGLTSSSANGKYVWDGGRPNHLGDYDNWCSAEGQPDIAKGACVYASQCKGFSLGWFSTKCGAMLPTYYFACQKNACSAENYCE